MTAIRLTRNSHGIWYNQRSSALNKLLSEPKNSSPNAKGKPREVEKLAVKHLQDSPGHRDQPGTSAIDGFCWIGITLTGADADALAEVVGVGAVTLDVAKKANVDMGAATRSGALALAGLTDVGYPCTEVFKGNRKTQLVQQNDFQQTTSVLTHWVCIKTNPLPHPYQ